MTEEQKYKLLVILLSIIFIGPALSVLFNRRFTPTRGSLEDDEWPGEDGHMNPR